MKLIYEECMIKKEGYPTFYCGINITDNWYEGKGDKWEVKASYVRDRCLHLTEADKFVDNPEEHDWKHEILADKLDYMRGRIIKEYTNLVEGMSPNKIDLDLISSGFTNYFLRAKLHESFTSHRDYLSTKVDEGIDYFKAFTETLLFDHYNVDKLVITYKGETYEVHKGSGASESMEDFEDDFDFEIEEDYSDFTINVENYRHREISEVKELPASKDGFYFRKYDDRYVASIKNLSQEEVKKLVGIFLKHEETVSGVEVFLKTNIKEIATGIKIMMSPELEDEIASTYGVSYYDFSIGG